MPGPTRGSRCSPSCPARGPFTALVILAEIGDITRFPAARKLASWAGLTPDCPRQRPRRALRAHLQTGLGLAAVGTCEAAQTARRSPQFAAGYQAIAQQRGKKITTTAVARKLLTRTWHLLTDAELAVPQPATAPAPDKQRR